MPRFLAPDPPQDAEGKAKDAQDFADGAGALNSRSVSQHNSEIDTTTLRLPAANSPPEHDMEETDDMSIAEIQIGAVLNRDPKSGVEIEADPPSHIATYDDPKDTSTEPLRQDVHVPQEVVEDPAEEQLSEPQLRKLFEDEEIERFLRHFNAHVQEVRLPVLNQATTMLATDSQESPHTPDRSQGDTLSPRTDNTPIGSLKVVSHLDEPENSEDGAWSMIDESYSAREGATNESEPPIDSTEKLTLSEGIARKFILPNLPPLQPTPDHRFTIGRARLQAERLNLVTQPAYGPFFSRMWRYASWKDRRTSAWYCAIFWMLWFYNLLLPALFAIILYTLFSRRIKSYPTLEQLRDRRREAARAEALGEEVVKRFATGPDFGLRDAWSLFRSVTKGGKKGQNKKRKASKFQEAQTKEDEDPAKVQVHNKEGGAVVEIDAQGESQVEKDVKRAILQAMTEISDLHERIKNIFLWRRPRISRIYAIALALLFLVTLILPAVYLAKLSYFVGGFFFWFIPPVIAGLPPADRARFPPAFADSPTDAQYAMELIALRVARGERVVPANPKPAKKKDRKSTPDDAGTSSRPQEKEVDWRKWGERAARGFAWAEGGKRVFKGDMAPLRQGTWPQTNAPDLAPRQTNEEIETATYPAQHTSGPGLLTLTSATLSFTQVLSSKPKVEIALHHIRGVKKTGKMGGLILKWGESDEGEREEKFRWVGGRDEVFAKLVGWRGRHWIQI